MDVKLVKELVVLNEGTKDERKFYTFSLKLSNGEFVKIQPNSYEDKKTKKKVSNYNLLSVIAEEILPFDK